MHGKIDGDGVREKSAHDGVREKSAHAGDEGAHPKTVILASSELGLRAAMACARAGIFTTIVDPAQPAGGLPDPVDTLWLACFGGQAHPPGREAGGPPDGLAAEQARREIRDLLGWADPALGVIGLCEAERLRASRLLEVRDDLDAVGEADLVLDMDDAPGLPPVRRERLAAIEALMPKDAVLASCAPLSLLRRVSGELVRPERLVAVRFSTLVGDPEEPADGLDGVTVETTEASDALPRLCEIAPLERTGASALRRVEAILARLGMGSCVSRRASATGASTMDRLFVAQVLEALDVLESSGLGPDAVDIALGEGRRDHRGPLEAADALGLDRVLERVEELAEAGRVRVPALLRRLVSRGCTGRRAGAGFYLYTSRGAVPNPSVVHFAKRQARLAG